MAEHSVADAKNGLPGLIDKARAGEQVIITRHGQPVAEIRPIAGAPRGEARTYSWLKARRASRKPGTMTSVDLLHAMYEGED